MNRSCEKLREFIGNDVTHEDFYTTTVGSLGCYVFIVVRIVRIPNIFKGTGLKTGFLESLILAQSERWRRG